MKESRCLTVATALLTLVALKAYMEWSAEQEEGFPTPHGVGWHSSSITPAQPLSEDLPVFVPQHFNASLQQLRQSIPKTKAYWNEKQHRNFRILEGDLEANASWNECFGPGTADRVAKIKDFGSYSELYRNFILYDECRTFPLLLNQPTKCTTSGKNHTFLLLAIKSLPGNFAARQAIRDTWGHEGAPGGLLVRTVFLLGTAQSRSGPRLQRLVEYESQTFGDILMWDFEDTFFNLTLKDYLFLNWTLEHCRKVRFILKGDDDVFINMPKVLDFLGSLDVQKPLYTGQVMANASPFRVRKSKYYVPESYYVGPYPAYAGGGGYIFSGPLAQWLHLVSRHIAFYPIDDVYTGLCFQALGIRPESHPGFQTFDIAEKDRDDPCVHSRLLLVHRRSPQQTLQLWKQITNPELKC
ncbi:N-acetyllactosaminide beta-1,3-N-acetylglucosaminyltransferase 2-like [Sceloporus undulatus]|uniref:N-acetyllactosaminide beta-1,3-N-acetylglucosaminyltransferase 2-like n=1 Tax=Sceloporus undulatus TaxID=8520 RepID=UPI001C4C699A|nr:N-acetyllactosaminide beta-1,3-N-acetylglucosaminyltransferase 2-like [Sceloporus undulatus]XP_042299524.1 N-acetyllactosaminide beta-1,3-N-acetylglucosaminyltransferase 2-like [Sceloporus undulatus]XP_042299614.1 N-acetyllactosaminide beta-1,3-N-acetylglucosaminyltransferase 2-like [Sceloporus undulatus]XP_042299615.1 N-acetyllactosaminide beta-1,3-N-acetylglucosaminyltransferase 2-like [Sceloporus undulatus]